MQKAKCLKIGLPKGSLQEKTFEIFRRAGFNIRLPSERSYFPFIDDPEIKVILLRAQEISRYVEKGILDCGITGDDWIKENGSKCVEIETLGYSKNRIGHVLWVLAVPENSKIKKLKDLEGKRIATELVNVTKNFLKEKNVKAEVEFSWGATEVKASQGLVSAIVELTETGESLKIHRLRPIATVFVSNTKFIANRDSYKDLWKRKKMESLALLLKGAVISEKKVVLKMNVEKRNLKEIISLLPALRKPTVSNLSEEDWFAVETVIDEEKVKDLIPKLKEAGAQGIIEYSLNKVVY
jgi:ATP phosphoribosyltransferase